MDEESIRGSVRRFVRRFSESGVCRVPVRMRSDERLCSGGEMVGVDADARRCSCLCSCLLA